MKVIKPKILFLVQLPPPIHGANLVNKQIVENKYIQNDYEIKVIPFNFSKENKDVGSISLSKFFILFEVFFSLAKSIFQFRPDLVFFNFSFKNAAFYRDLILISVLKIFRINMLFFLQGKGINEILIKNPYKKWLFKFAFRNSYILCLSDLLTYDVKEIFHGLPYVVNNGIKVENLENIKFTKNNKVVTLIYLSALSEKKGLLVLLDAIKILKSKNIDFILKIVGGTLTLTEQDVQDYIDLIDIDDKVQLLGVKYGDDKFKELLESDIFVFPTLNEAFGLVNIEAMQCGLPVISTFEGAIPEIVDDGKTGFLVVKNNPEALADKIEILIKNPELRKKMGDAGCEKFLDKYTLDIFEKNMKSVFDDVLKKSK